MSGADAAATHDSVLGADAAATLSSGAGCGRRHKSQLVVLRGKVHSKELTLAKQKQQLEVKNEVDENKLRRENGCTPQQLKLRKKIRAGSKPPKRNPIPT